MYLYECYVAELLFSLFEPLIGASSIQYANGEDWEDRRKWLYESLRGSCLESYISHFVKVLRLYYMIMCNIEQIVKNTYIRR